MDIEVIKKEYNEVLKSGMFWEFFPDLSGNWIEDHEFFTNWYLKNRK